VSVWVTNKINMSLLTLSVLYFSSMYHSDDKLLDCHEDVNACFILYQNIFFFISGSLKQQSYHSIWTHHPDNSFMLFLLNNYCLYKQQISS
jgi:hypothetical protein